MKTLALFTILSALLRADKILTLDSLPSSDNTATQQVFVNSTQPAIAVDNPVYNAPFAGSDWISNVQSGNPALPGWVEYPNGTVLLFTDTFIVPAGFTVKQASINVMIDDYGTGVLNGQTIYTPASRVECIAACIPVAIDITSLIRPGVNIFTTTDIQAFDDAMATDFAGFVDLIPTTDTPEVSSFGLSAIGIGALLLIGAFRRLAPKP